MGNCLSLCKVEDWTPGTTYVFNGKKGDVPWEVVHVVVADGITDIPHEAFWGCKILESIYLPSSVTSISEGAFKFCESLRSIDLPQSLTTIENRAFGDCLSLVTIDLPPSVTTIGKDAFQNCNSFKSIDLPPSLTTISRGAFTGCNSLVSITLPPSLVTIGDNAFEKCRSLVSVALPPSLATIGDAVFQECHSLTEITLPPSMTTIPENTFHECFCLKKIILPDTVKSIRDHAFNNCFSLATICLPTSVEEIHAAAFEGCINLIIEEYDVIGSIVGKGGVDPRETFLNNPWHPHMYADRVSGNKFKVGPGPNNGFGGRTQKGWSPDMWGLSLEQVMLLKQHPLYNRKGKDGEADYLMDDLVKDIKRITDGTGMGLSLLINQEKPLKAEVMVSHAWKEPIRHFVEAIEASGEQGPFWICALCIYQNDNESEGVTIAQQLGTDPKFGPFATALKSARIMVAVLTGVCDIYTRLWCVYEMHYAIGLGVPVRLCPHISPDAFEDGLLKHDICVAQVKVRVDSNEAHCRFATDEIAIRNNITSSANGFDLVDESVERIRLSYLAAYPTKRLGWNRWKGFDKIREAIEILIPHVNLNNLKSYDQFLQEKLEGYPGWSIRIKHEENSEAYKWNGEHDLYIERDGETPIDVFKEWSAHIQDVMMLA